MNYKKNNIYIDSPINYSGNKYKFLDFILPLFPQDIDTFYDLFCGGGSVIANASANKIVANDINKNIIDILKFMSQHSSSYIIHKIKEIIDKHNLSVDNKKSFNLFRDYYNNIDNSPINLFVLSCFSFNYYIRFNKRGKYNASSGYMCNQYNPSTEKKISAFAPKIRDIVFKNDDIFNTDWRTISTKDFVYLDPPYVNSVAPYNDGNRLYRAWSKNDDLKIFEVLDMLSRRGVRWAMSNAFLNKGIKNEWLIEWSANYHVHDIRHNKYSTNYQRKSTSKTQEVLITNY